MISVVIPAKNEEDYILDCLRSITAQKCEEKVEIIAVDNNSTDNTYLIVQRDFPQVRVVKEAVWGTNPARQRGFLEAQGEIVVFLDADVRLPPGWLSRVASKFSSSSRIVALSGPYKFYDFKWYWDVGNWIIVHFLVYPWSFLMTYVFRTAGYLLGGSMAIRKETLKAAGGFNTSLKFYGDELDTGSRLKKFGRVAFFGDLWVHSSARRYNKNGVITTLAVYWLNYFWLIFTKRPYNLRGERLLDD